MPKLSVIDGPHKGEEFVFTENRVLAGRDLNNAIRLPDGLVSRHHAEIVRAGDNYVMRDLQSTNGTFVNDEPVIEVALKDGDIIRLADVVIRYHCDAIREPAKPSASVGLSTPIFKQPPAAPIPEGPVAEIKKPVLAPDPVPVKAPAPPAPPKAVILKIDPPKPPEPVEPEPGVPLPARPAEKKRLYTKAFPGPAAPRPKPVEDNLSYQAPTGRRIAPPLIAALVGVLGLIAGYSLDSNALRFWGLLLLVVGLLCLFHDWSPLPPKPKTQ